jgi:hypothetical protein
MTSLVGGRWIGMTARFDVVPFHPIEGTIVDAVFDIQVMNEWFAQGEVRVGDRRFWYKCDSGSQYLAELDSDSDDEFVELDATCMCEVGGGQHIPWTDGVNVCETVWDADPVKHERDAGLLVEVLLNKRR